MSKLNLLIKLLTLLCIDQISECKINDEFASITNPERGHFFESTSILVIKQLAVRNPTDKRKGIT